MATTTATAVAYANYCADEPPKHPGDEWTRFVCISDTHSQTRFVVPPGDVLIHAGDLSSWGMHMHLKKTVDWLMSLPHELKIIIAGNHDLSLDPAWITNEDGTLMNWGVDERIKVGDGSFHGPRAR